MDNVLLDCTLRDGGYYTNWDWDRNLVFQYLEGIEGLVSYVELGLKTPSDKEGLGPFAYLEEAFMDKLSHDYYNYRRKKGDFDLSRAPTFVAMVNAADFIGITRSIMETEAYIDSVFVKSEDSLLSGVRVAFRKEDFTLATFIMERLNQLGYEVFANIMGAKDVSYQFLMDVASYCNQKSYVKAIYLADSFGNISPDALREKFTCLFEYTPLDFGFHAHDNSGLASKCAANVIDLVKYIDTTILGMGRGAGNLSLKTAHYLLYAANYILYKDVNDCLNTKLENLFKDLHEKYNWGTNALYQFAARNNVHPSYPQHLMRVPFLHNAKEYPELHFLEAKDVLNQVIRYGMHKSFDKGYLEEILESRSK